VLFTNPLPGKFVTFVGSDDVELGYKEALYLFRHMGGKGRIVAIEGEPAARPAATVCVAGNVPSPSFPALKFSRLA